MLSHPVASSPLPLPLKAFGEVVMRALAIDAWAAALGHPLELDVAEADYQLEHRRGPRMTGSRTPTSTARSRPPRAATSCSTSCATPRPAAPRCRATASGASRSSGSPRRRAWSFWVRTPEEGQAVQRLVLMAEAWFIAAHGGVTSSRDLSVDPDGQ